MRALYGLALVGLVMVSPAHARDSRECLADAIYHEARGQSLLGQIAVAQVVLNRVNDGRFPSDVCAVVYQRSKGKCQFSWVCRPMRSKREPEAWKLAMSVARFTLEDVPDQTNQALYFHAKHARLNWPHLRRVAHVGGHVFYADRQRFAAK